MRPHERQSVGDAGQFHPRRFFERGILEHVNTVDPKLAGLVTQEENRIESTLDLIAAENHTPKAVLEIMGSVLNTKTIEGYPGRRFHAGCVHVDEIETLAIQRCKKLFGAEYANVQPHSGSSANLAVYFSVLQPGDNIMAMSLPHGGHLSHGHAASITSKCFNFQHYALNPETERIDYDRLASEAEAFQPRMIVAGASSYSRLIDYERMAAIAHDVGACLLADIAHLAGLVAAEAIPSPVPHCDFVTFTCYKTLMGGRGGVILARDKYAKPVNRTIFPGSQGTSPVNMIAAKALIFHLARETRFKQIQFKTLENARLLAERLIAHGYRLVSGGTDNHQVLVDLTPQGIDGGKAEKSLEAAGLVLNRNVVPRDAGKAPGSVSGIRIGTAAVTTRGIGPAEIAKIADWIHRVLSAPDDIELQQGIQTEVCQLCQAFPVYAQNR